MAATKRDSRLRAPFVIVLVSSCIILGLSYSYFNFELLSTFSTSALPRTVQKVCNGSTEASHRILDAWSAEPTAGNPNTTCSQPCNCKKVACPPAGEKVIVEEKIVEKIVNVGPIFDQWWARGKPWHSPAKFPLCSMDACFNFTRCEDMEELLVYHYDIPGIGSGMRYFERLNSTVWSTSDPDKACLFFVYQDSDNPWRSHPNTLPYWNHGLNHVLITFADLWHQKNPPEETIENASVLSSGLSETTYRHGFDMGIPLPGKAHVPHLQVLKPLERKYFVTFRGTRYLGYHHGEGCFRSHASFRNMHNGKDVIVVTTCSHGVNDLVRKEKPELGKGCDEDQKLYDQYEFNDLMNSTFCLAPAGISGSSYRFIEVLSAGAIPVLIVDNHVKPFENLIQWPRCALQFPTSEIHLIVPALRKMSQEEIEARQKYCLWVYDEFLKDDATILRSVMRALKVRFFGVFAEFSDISLMYAGKMRRRLQFLYLPSSPAVS